MIHFFLNKSSSHRILDGILRQGHEVIIIELDLPAKARIVLYYRDEKFHFAEGDSKLKKDDEIVILTHSKNLAELNERWNPKQVEKN